METGRGEAAAEPVITKRQAMMRATSYTVADAQLTHARCARYDLETIQGLNFDSIRRGVSPEPRAVSDAERTSSPSAPPSPAASAPAAVTGQPLVA